MCAVTERLVLPAVRHEAGEEEAVREEPAVHRDARRAAHHVPGGASVGPGDVGWRAGGRDGDVGWRAAGETLVSQDEIFCGLKPGG